MSRNHGPFATTNPWRSIGWATSLGLVAGTALVGFLVLPVLNRGPSVPVWTAICTAAGLLPTPQARTEQPAARYASAVRWTAGEVAAVGTADTANGAFVAVNCTACHGDRGVSGQDWIPSLAGMRPEALYKQLADYKTGHRSWAIMNAIAGALSDQDMRDVAAYFGSLLPASGIEKGGALSAEGGLRSDDPVVRLVYAGDPTRGIAPCASCHGLNGLKRAAPVLAGQHPAYLNRQLGAFHDRLRTNDEGEQMRVTAARLTDEEMQGLSRFLASGRR